MKNRLALLAVLALSFGLIASQAPADEPYPSCLTVYLVNGHSNPDGTISPMTEFPVVLINNDSGEVQYGRTDAVGAVRFTVWSNMGYMLETPPHDSLESLIFEQFDMQISGADGFQTLWGIVISELPSGD